MREPACCAELRLRLVRQGLPADRVGRIVRELSEHWEDLYNAALGQDHSVAEAAAQADERLGAPDQLEAAALASLRRSSWLGRHPILALSFVPLLLTPVLMAAILAPLGCLDRFVHFTHWGNPNGEANERLVVGVMWGIYYTALLSAPTWLCWRVWRAGLGWRWILAMCAWCTFAALLWHFEADTARRHISMALGIPWQLNLHSAGVFLIHVLIAGAFLLGIRSSTKRAIQFTKGQTSHTL